MTAAAVHPRPAPQERRAAWLLGPPALIALTAAILLAMGQPAVCTCGTIALWHGKIASPETSQQLTDPYTFTHLIHGALFYLLLWLVGRLRGRPLRLSLGFLIATALECGWEIVENSPVVIERLRTATIDVGYRGDSVLNSVSDICAMMLGFWAAARLPVWLTVAAVIGIEAALGYLVRDNFVLSVLMMLIPIESIKAWQAAA